jgi:hypothetical protein
MARHAVLSVELGEACDIGWGFPFVSEGGFSRRLAGNESEERN